MGRTNRHRKRKRTILHHSLSIKLFDFIYINLTRALTAVGWTNETKLNVGQFELTGRGVYSSRNIPSNGLIISLPANELISIATIEDDGAFKCLLRETLGSTSSKISSQSLLSFYLLYLKHHNRRTEYIATIPSEFSTPYFCEENEIQLMIKCIKNRIENQSKIIYEDCKTFRISLGMKRCHCCDLLYADDIFNKNDFKWAFFAVNSRSVYFGPNLISAMTSSTETLQYLNDEANLALAPFLDLLNHSSEAKTSVNFDETKKHYQLRSALAMPKFSQIFISYGSLDNVKLLTDYGFYLPNNYHDVVYICDESIVSILHRIPYRIKTFVEKYNLNKDLYISREMGCNLQLCIFAFIATQNESEFNENETKKCIYGDAEQFQTLSSEANGLLAKIVDNEIEMIQKSIDSIEKLLKTQKRNSQIEIYFDFCRERINWLQKIADKNDVK